MTYEITIESPHATKTYRRARRDAAEFLYRRCVYGVLKSRALLDRPIAARAMVRACKASLPDCHDLSIPVQDMTIRFVHTA